MTSFDNRCIDCDKPIRDSFDRCYDCDQAYRGEELKLEGKLSTETAKGYGAKLRGYGEEIVWFPKSLVVFHDGAFWVPRWLALEKDLLPDG